MTCTFFSFHKTPKTHGEAPLPPLNDNGTEFWKYISKFFVHPCTHFFTRNFTSFHFIIEWGEGGDTKKGLWKKRRQRGRKPKKRARSLTNTVGEKSSVPRRKIERLPPLSFVVVPPRRGGRILKMYFFQDNVADSELPVEH